MKTEIGLKAKILALEEERLGLPLQPEYGSKADSDILINLGKRIALKETVEMIEEKIKFYKSMLSTDSDRGYEIYRAQIQVLEGLL